MTTEKPIVDINARLIDDILFVDIDALASFLRNEYSWARRTADALKQQELVDHADGMQSIVETIEFNAMKLREELS